MLRRERRRSARGRCLDGERAAAATAAQRSALRLQVLHALEAVTQGLPGRCAGESGATRASPSASRPLEAPMARALHRRPTSANKRGSLCERRFARSLSRELVGSCARRLPEAEGERIPCEECLRSELVTSITRRGSVALLSTMIGFGAVYSSDVDVTRHDISTLSDTITSLARSGQAVVAHIASNNQYHHPLDERLEIVS